MGQEAEELRRRLLLGIHFRALYTFKDIQNKRLMQQRSLNAYLTETRPIKLQERIVEALRKNMDKKIKKQNNMRKAMKFNLLRTQKHYRLKMAMSLLKLKA